MHTLLATLGDPVRFRIVELLANGEHAVSELVEQLDIHQSGVSRHLSMLLELGLVQVRRSGQYRLYSLLPNPFQEIETWATECQTLWHARLDRLDAALTKKLSSRIQSGKQGDTL